MGPSYDLSRISQPYLRELADLKDGSAFTSAFKEVAAAATTTTTTTVILLLPLFCYYYDYTTTPSPMLLPPRFASSAVGGSGCGRSTLRRW